MGALLLAAAPRGVDANEFLLPISANALPGGYGTYWTATLIVLNRGTEAVLVTVDRTCAVTGLCPDAVVAYPGQWRATGLEGRGRGNLMRIENGTPEFSYRLYVGESTADRGRVLTELPIVPVASLCSEPLTLFKIDLVPGTRHALRIYDASGVDNPVVRVTATNMFSDAVLFDGEVLLEKRSDLHPAEAKLFDFLPSPDSILVTVQPLDPEMRTWAFLSVTDNITNDLVLYTPQTPTRCD
ncbi:MAG: hypothetical protein ABR517_11740 [Thermoanaerobaculia bacterium]